MDLSTAPFCVKSYSKLKFGSDIAARKLGYELAVRYYNAHADTLIANKCVVFSSPYNYIPNAATVMTKHFIDKLNDLLINACGRGVEYSVIHRKVSYTNDYGFLSKEKRKGLIDNDSFYLNSEFIKGKFLIFVDDVRITGTHEDKLKEVLIKSDVPNDAHFLYFASYNGYRPDIEGQLNFAAMTGLSDYAALSKEPGHHVIIRPIKYILSQPSHILPGFLRSLDDRTFFEVYYGCIAEGYFKIPSYQEQFTTLASEKLSREAVLVTA